MSVFGGSFDPLLKNLDEKNQRFRQNALSLAAELKEVCSRLAYQEQSFARGKLTRQEGERKVKKMEDEICRLQERLEERDGQLQASASAVDKPKYYEGSYSKMVEILAGCKSTRCTFLVGG